MAFSVTPTSGASPYTFTAQINNAINIDGSRYTLRFQSSTAVGSCPALGSTVNLSDGVVSLLASGSYISNDDVPTGSCRTFTLRIRDNETSAFIAQETINISNI